MPGYRPLIAGLKDHTAKVQQTTKLKNKAILITAIIFFLAVNTAYYWEGKLGFYVIPAFLILGFIYLALGIALIRQIYFWSKEKFKDKTRLINIGVLTAVLILTFLNPSGLIDFDKLEGENVLVAEREGAADCMTIIKFKDDFTFTERSFCFGITEIKGNYHLQNDTIYFDHVNVGRHEKEFYKFAVIEPSKFNKDGKHFDLIRYKSLEDTSGHELWITKDNLNKLKDKNPYR